MFRLLKRIILLGFILAVVLIVILIAFPNRYDNHVTAVINAPREKVFDRAKNLSQWHLIVMLNGAGMAQSKLPKEIEEQVKSQMPVNVDSLMAAIPGAKELMNMQIKVIKEEAPAWMVFEIEGGPMHGMQPELRFSEVEQTRTLAEMTESFTFEGFFGSVKAFAAKYGMKTVNQQNLTNLKTLSERP